MSYKFDLINKNSNPSPQEAIEALRNRPFVRLKTDFQEEAKYFVSPPELDTSINTAIALGLPLLITGEPGVGKTQTAYYVANKLSLKTPLHFQVKSTSKAVDLLYKFDAVAYLRESNIRNTIGSQNTQEEREVVDKQRKTKLITYNFLGEAIKSECPTVLVVDEIDKAPKDFPNDLLDEIDKMRFFVPEIEKWVESQKEKRPIVFITSNGERPLPEPFLRRCIYHNIVFSEKMLNDILEKRKEEFRIIMEMAEAPPPNNRAIEKTINDLQKSAIEKFMELRGKSLQKKPSTAEFLAWLKILFLHWKTVKVKELPFVNVLLKDKRDIEQVTNSESYTY